MGKQAISKRAVISQYAERERGARNLSCKFLFDVTMKKAKTMQGHQLGIIPLLMVIGLGISLVQCSGEKSGISTGINEIRVFDIHSAQNGRLLGVISESSNLHRIVEIVNSATQEIAVFPGVIKLVIRSQDDTQVVFVQGDSIRIEGKTYKCSVDLEHEVSRMIEQINDQGLARGKEK
jgi:uncharacterized protein (UPF0248 family)